MKELCKRLIEAKLAEDAAKRSRIEAENALIAAFGETKTEGSTTRTYGSYKVTVTKKVSRSLDFDAYRALNLPPDHQFVDMKPAINLKKLRLIEGIDPALVASCVTAKPAKPYVKIEEVKSEAV